jgi:hypothetical protein
VYVVSADQLYFAKTTTKSDLHPQSPQTFPDDDMRVRRVRSHTDTLTECILDWPDAWQRARLLDTITIP